MHKAFNVPDAPRYIVYILRPAIAQRRFQIRERVTGKVVHACRNHIAARIKCRDLNFNSQY